MSELKYVSLFEVESVHESRIEELLLHPLWNSNTMKNDIALIKLKDPVPKFNKFINAICLPESTTQFGTDDCCTLAGWGKTAADESQLRKFIDIESAYRVRVSL